MSRKIREDTRRYHHGDLRNALVQAALAILEREGLDGLSLRAVAADVGVSHAAPAHHFGSLKALRNALAAIGYARFAAAMRDHRSNAPPDHQAQMRAAGEGYLAFASSHPALFRLMFSADRLDWSDEELLAQARSARQQLEEVCAPAAERLGIAGDAAARLALEQMVWADVHGRAHLTIDGQFGPLEAAAPCLDIAELIFSHEPRKR